MTDIPVRSSSRRNFLIYAAVTALIAAAVFLSLRTVSRAARLSRMEERDLRVIHLFGARIRSRVRSVLARIEGAELFIAEKPPSPKNAARALAFALGEGSKRVGHVAAVVLDERGGILSSRRREGFPPPGGKERIVWRRAVSALRNQKKTFGGKFHIGAEILEGVGSIFVVAPSPSTKGYWGVILPAEELFSIGRGELGPRESAFLLSLPDHTVLYARQGEKFLHEAIGRSFEKNLALALGMLACCDSAAFNTVHEGDRWMNLLDIPGGTREIQIVRVADRRAAAAARMENLPLVGGGVAAGWVLLLAIFPLLGTGGARRAPAAPDVGSLVREESKPSLDRSILTALLQVSEAVAEGEDFREVVSRAAKEAARRLEAGRAYAALYDEGMGQLFEVYSSGVGEEYRAAVALHDEKLPERIAIREADVVEVTAVAQWDEAPEALKKEGSGSVAVFPMKSCGRVIGLMSFHFDDPHTMQDEEIDFCALLALQGAEAVAHALSLAEPPPER